MKALQFVGQRLTESSSRAGIGALFAACAMLFPEYALPLNVIGGLVGGSAAITPDVTPRARPVRRRSPKKPAASDVSSG